MPEPNSLAGPLKAADWPNSSGSPESAAKADLWLRPTSARQSQNAPSSWRMG